METNRRHPRNSWSDGQSSSGNRPSPETPPDIPPAETELPISCDKPTKAEIKKAIMTLRSGKAAGPGEIPAEAIKADMETVTNMLHSLFSKIWEKEEVPAQWKGGIVIKLPKKGDLRDCNNYRGIMLLSVPDKVLNRVLLERMKEAVDPKLRDQQAGFRRNRPHRQCTHHSRAVAGVELPSLHQLHRQWEGLRQCGQRDAVEAAEALRSPGEDHRPHPLYLPGHELQYRSRRQKASRSRLESVKGACCHHFSSFWSSTGSWRPPQQAGTTGYSGHPGRSWMTSTLLMTWCSCHTTTDICRTKPPAWRPYQLGQDSRSARGKQSWWRLTPLPTHQSQSMESPSGKCIPSSTLGVQLTDRGARTEMSQPGLARPEQLLSCSRTSGRPRRSGQEPNFASSTPMWSQSCSTDAKLRGRQRQCYRKSRHSSTPVCGASTTSDGQRWSQMKSCGSERDRNQ